MRNYKNVALTGMVVAAGLAVGYVFAKKTLGRPPYINEKDLVNAMALGYAMDAIEAERKSGISSVMLRN